MSRHLDDLFAGYPPHLTVEQLASVLGIKRSTAYTWLSTGKVPAYRLEGTWIILRDEVKAWVLEARNTPPGSGDERPAST